MSSGNISMIIAEWGDERSIQRDIDDLRAYLDE